jgi:Flp pilus assembly pilin Flp
MPFHRAFDTAQLMLRREQGQTMAEYGVVLAVLVVAIVLTIVALSGGINDAFDRVIPHL